MISAMKVVRWLQPKPDLSKPLLVTIGSSHYAEKARWCMDMSPLRDHYVEELHCPALHLSSTLVALDHLPRVRTWGADETFVASVQQRHPRVKEKTGVPKLVLPSSLLENNSHASGLREILSSKGLPLSPSTETATDKHHTSVVVQGGSAGIMRFLADIFPDDLGFLYPDDKLLRDQVVALDEVFDVELGRAATAWCFGNILLTGEKFYRGSGDAMNAPKDIKLYNSQSVDAMLRTVRSQDLPYVEKFLFCNFGPFLIPLMLRTNNITAEEKLKAKEKIYEIFRQADELLDANCRGLTDPCSLFGLPKPTAADITFACLASPILMPPQLEGLMPSYETLQAILPDTRPEFAGCVELAEFAQELRKNFSSAQFCLSLYNKFRFQTGDASLSTKVDNNFTVVQPRTAQYFSNQSSIMSKIVPKKNADPNSCRPIR